MGKRCLLTFLLVGTFAAVALAPPAASADWPAYRHDGRRSGATAEQTGIPLHLQWTYRPGHAPQPAWEEPGKELNRLDFDYAYQVAVAGGVVYFGSSADCKVYALDLDTGQEHWSFFTEAPVRFAPTVWEGRVFVASDDGYVYCLSADEGKLLWKLRGAPRGDRLLGNGRMISRWPLRSGVLVEDGVAYFAAGMWPSEGIFVYAVQADTGQQIWCNDTSGTMYMKLPHGGAEALTGVAPQGYLLLSEDTLFVPTGRSVPAAFDRRTGRFLYYWAAENKHHGGSWATVLGDLIFCGRHPGGPDIDVRLGEAPPASGDGLMAWRGRTGDARLTLTGKHRLVASADLLYASGAGNVTAFDRRALLGGAKPGEATKWQAPCERVYSLILAGNTVFAGAAGKVMAVDAIQGNQLWTGTVKGQARGLAVADGRLLVSTSTGDVVCFGPQEAAWPVTVSPEVDPSPYPETRLGSAAEALAERIVEDTGITAGYCLDYGAGGGRLAYELAKRTDLRIYCIEPDVKKAASARRALDAAGLYGVRVTVHHGPLDKLPYASYFADLIISGGGWQRAREQGSAAELYRVLRPCGGVAYLASARGGGSRSGKGLENWLQSAAVPAAEIQRGRGAVRIVRGPLPGAGSWTHQYADAGKSSCAPDERVRLPLALLWFGGPGPARMMSRHWGTAAPVSANGRMFITGQHEIIAVDAYTGRELWSHEVQNVGLRGVKAVGSNLAADDDSVYVASGARCLRLDAATGEVRQEYAIPAAPASDVAERPELIPGEVAESLIWGYLGQWGEMVFGSAGSRAESPYLFGLGRDDGQPRWVYQADQIVRHNAIAVGPGRVFLIDRTSQEMLDQAKRRGETLTARGALVALDAATGGEVWRTAEGLGGRADLWFAGGVVLASSGGGMTAYSAEDGKLLWQRTAKLERYPVIVGDTIYAQPFAYDLRTGEPKRRRHPLTGKDSPWSFRKAYGCGHVSAAPAMLFFRSGAVGFCDLIGDAGITNFGGIRPGCFVNIIAANGLVLIPEASSACTCSYNYQTSVALAPSSRNEEWFVFSEPSEAAVVRRLALNVGAPGDQRGADGTLWLSFPRPPAPAAIQAPMTVELLPDMGYYRQDSDTVLIRGTEQPWVYASGCRGLRRAELQLSPTAETEQPPERYTVRLHFAELDDVPVGQRVFDVKLQEKAVLEDFDVVREAGGPRRALLKEFRGVEANGRLLIELVGKVEGATASTAPIISGIELMLEQA